MRWWFHVGKTFAVCCGGNMVVSGSGGCGACGCGGLSRFQPQRSKLCLGCRILICLFVFRSLDSRHPPL